MAQETERPGGQRRLSLATRLILLIGLLALGPLFVTNFVGYMQSRADMKLLALQSLESSARVASIQTQVFIDEKRHLIPSLIAGNEYLRETVKETSQALRRGTPLRDDERLHRHLAAKAERTQHVEEFYVLDVDGRVLGSSRKGVPAGEVQPDDPCSRMAFSAGPTTAMEYSGNEPFFDVAAPIWDTYGSRIGTFCARFRFDVHEELNQLAHSQSPEKRFLIVDVETNRTVCGSFDDHHFGDPLPDSLLDELRAGETWAGRYEGRMGAAPSDRTHRSPPEDHGPPLDDGSHGHAQQVGGSETEPRLAAVAPISGTTWVTMADLTEVDAFATLDELKERVAWMGSGFLVLVLLGIGMTVRTTVTPLRDLLDATRRMKDGRFDQRVRERGPREIAELSEVFNDMSHHVSRLHDTLEDRVDQRTRELQHRTDELKRNEAFSELLFDSIDQNLLVVDGSLVIIQANEVARQTYGDDIIGRHCFQAFEDRDSPCPQCPVTRIFDSGEPISQELVYNRDDRSEIMDVKAFPLPTAETESDKVLIVSREITDERRQQAQMAHHEKMSAFALLSAGIAHEIGNPLASIKAQIQATRHDEETEREAETLEIVDAEVDRISRLLRQLVNFARRRQSVETFVSWNRVVEDTVQLLRHDPRSRGVEIETHLASGLPAVRADEDRMLQILLNLGINGVDAIDGRGCLVIETDVEGDDVCLRVRDSGPGIPREVGERIFEPYFTTKPSDGGTGLGLFVTRKLVEELGGEIYHESTDDGTCFVVTLPAASMTAEDASTPT